MLRGTVELLEALFCMLVKLVILNELSHQSGLIIVKKGNVHDLLLLTLLWRRLS